MRCSLIFFIVVTLHRFPVRPEEDGEGAGHFLDRAFFGFRSLESLLQRIRRVDGGCDFGFLVLVLSAGSLAFGSKCFINEGYPFRGALGFLGVPEESENFMFFGFAVLDAVDVIGIDAPACGDGPGAQDKWHSEYKKD
jgi:hypothetical protein